MSDKTRTLSEVNQEYANSCARAGNIQYQIVVKETEIAMLQEDLKKLNETLRDLNFEGAKIQAEEKKAQ